MTNPQPAVRVDAAVRRARYLLNRLNNDDGLGIGEIDTMLREVIALTPAPTEAGGVREAAIDALTECEEYFDNRADADCDQDGFIPNKEMRLLSVVRTARAALSSTPAADAGWRRVRHKKRGTTYAVLGEGEVQISRAEPAEQLPAGGDRRLSEGDTLTVYRCDQTGKLWLRFPDEFEDGRFEALNPEARDER